MASPTAIVGSRMSHLRRRTISKYSPILRGRNSTLIELLLDCHRDTETQRKPREIQETLVLFLLSFAFLCASVSLRPIVPTKLPAFCALRLPPGNSSSRLNAKQFRSLCARRPCRLWRRERRPDGSSKSVLAGYCCGARLLH